jgi:hypothetical protein
MIAESTSDFGAEQDEHVAFETRIRKRIRDFDLGALMRALAHRGYGVADVMFESNVEETSPESIVEAIRFVRAPRRSAIVTLNLGLLGSQGLLPSYFQRVIQEGDDPERFYDFIRFFDDRLLHNFVRALYPETDRAVYADWTATRKHYLKILGVGSTMSLHRVLRDVFPELAVRVRRVRIRTRMDAFAVRTGFSQLDGSAVLGGRYDVEPAGLSIDLVTEDGLTEGGQRWPSVVLERLHARIFPLLAPYHIAVAVRLTTLAHGNWVRVETQPEDASSELGFDRMRSPEEVRHTVVLFEGIP